MGMRGARAHVHLWLPAQVAFAQNLGCEKGLSKLGAGGEGLSPVPWVCLVHVSWVLVVKGASPAPSAVPSPVPNAPILLRDHLTLFCPRPVSAADSFTPSLPLSGMPAPATGSGELTGARSLFYGKFLNFPCGSGSSPLKMSAEDTPTL